MAKHRYKILSADVQDARGRLSIDPALPPFELEQEVDLDLGREQRVDLTAAGWVEPLDDDEDDEPKSKAKK
jgi:hypothetical protein